VLTSANVACGFHAGDPSTMRQVCESAVRAGVAIGAQVGYRDLAGFGRRRIDYAPDELRDDVLYQLGALDGFARVAGARVRYVKPHGALYNTVVTDEVQAGAVVSAVASYDPTLPVLGLPRSALHRLAAAAGLRAIAEGFADRGYLPSGALVPRGRPGALVTDPGLVARRAVRMAVHGTVLAIDGSEVSCQVESLCVHGDTPGAVELAAAVRSALTEADVPLVPFVI
jgi:5-oxoprolinase (ATP-hydrolysing) subunit A